VPDREPIGLGHAVEMVRGDEASGAGHVLHDHRRASWDVPAHVPRDDPGVGVEPAAGREADDDPDGLAVEEGLRVETAACDEQDRDGRERDESFVHAVLSGAGRIYHADPRPTPSDNRDKCQRRQLRQRVNRQFYRPPRCAGGDRGGPPHHDLTAGRCRASRVEHAGRHAGPGVESS
jgi:hypothetical protein